MHILTGLAVWFVVAAAVAVVLGRVIARTQSGPRV